MPNWREPGFQWDDGNIDHIFQRHGVDPHEVEEVFFFDPVVRRDGDVYRVYGRTFGGKYLALVCEWRGDQLRVFSARPMNDQEKRRYDRR